MHFRGCSGEINLLQRSYHGGETKDPNFIFQLIRRRLPGIPLFAVGYSLGANILLKWLGEEGSDVPLTAAVAVAVPFDLRISTKKLEHGLSRIYQYWLLRSMKDTVKRKAHLLQNRINISGLLGAKTFQDFDNLGTAPVHGFRDADDYYKKSSCRAYLRNISTPVLILQALDDPLLCTTSIPKCEELGPGITLEISESGGHVGFVKGCAPGFAQYWLDQRITEYIGSWIN